MDTDPHGLKAKKGFLVGRFNTPGGGVVFELENHQFCHIPIRVHQCSSVVQLNCSAESLHFHTLPRLRLDDFDLGMADADLLLKPLARIIITMAEQDGAGRNLADEI
jgi:hypothetical protein